MKLCVTIVTSNEVRQMSNQSVVKRIPKEKAEILNFLARKMKWLDTVTYNEVIEASPVFQKARKEYELSGDSA